MWPCTQLFMRLYVFSRKKSKSTDFSTLAFCALAHQMSTKRNVAPNRSELIKHRTRQHLYGVCKLVTVPSRLPFQHRPSFLVCLLVFSVCLALFGRFGVFFHSFFLLSNSPFTLSMPTFPDLPYVFQCAQSHIGTSTFWAKPFAVFFIYFCCLVCLHFFCTLKTLIKHQFIGVV